MYPLLLSMLLAATSPVPAAADDAPTARVSYHDLDLTTVAGANRLKMRLRSAVTDLCVDNRSRDLESRRRRDACFAAARRSAESSYDAALAAATPRAAVDLASK